MGPVLGVVVWLICKFYETFYLLFFKVFMCAVDLATVYSLITIGQLIFIYYFIPRVGLLRIEPSCLYSHMYKDLLFYILVRHRNCAKSHQMHFSKFNLVNKLKSKNKNYSARDFNIKPQYLKLKPLILAPFPKKKLLLFYKYALIFKVVFLGTLSFSRMFFLLCDNIMP